MFRAALLIGLTAASACNASQPREAAASPDLSPELMQAISGWATCRSDYIRDHLNDEVAPSALVDTALGLCVEHERSTEIAFDRMGQAGVLQTRQLKARFRTSLIATVVTSRAGAEPADPGAAWGFCIGRNVPETVDANGVEAAIDRAFIACEDRQQIVRQHLRQNTEAARAEANLDTIRHALRERARNMLRNQ